MVVSVLLMMFLFLKDSQHRAMIGGPAVDRFNEWILTGVRCPFSTDDVAMGRDQIGVLCLSDVFAG